MLKDVFQGLLDLVYPKICLLCRGNILPGGQDDVLCPACQEGLARNRPPFCRKCSRPLPDPDELFCDHCRQTDLAFDRVWAATIYDPAVRRLIHLFKYADKTALRRPFSRLMLDFIERFGIPAGRFDLMMPVPLHHARLRERGYNQARLLAEAVAGPLGLRMVPDGLARRRHTRNQARLRPKERWTNLDEAFKITQPGLVNNKRVMIVDDLMTSGATLSGIARVLKRAGAREVSAVTLAMTAHPRDD